jgi:phage replication-related protein YjqB (UPF0714/DUF867 family)
VLAELLNEPGVKEVCELRGSFGFMALHGGSQDRMTDEIAGAAAHASQSSFYAVIMPPDLRWHLTSAKFLARDSASLAQFLKHNRKVISIHGYGCDGLYLDGPWIPESETGRDLSRSRALIVGGRQRSAAARVCMRLRETLMDYDVLMADARFPGAGTHPDNPVNRTKAWGVQIELPPSIRGLGPIAAPGSDTRRLIETLATIASE